MYKFALFRIFLFLFENQINFNLVTTQESCFVDVVVVIGLVVVADVVVVIGLVVVADIVVVIGLVVVADFVVVIGLVVVADVVVATSRILSSADNLPSSCLAIFPKGITHPPTRPFRFFLYLSYILN